MATYLVTQEGSPQGTKPRMVEARTKASAIAHVARTSFDAVPLSMKEAINWTKEGVDLEEAGAEDQSEPTAE